MCCYVRNASVSSAIEIKSTGLYDACTYSRDIKALRLAHSCPVDSHRTVWSLHSLVFLFWHASLASPCLITLLIACQTTDIITWKNQAQTQLVSTLGFCTLKRKTNNMSSSVFICLPSYFASRISFVWKLLYQRSIQEDTVAICRK